MEDVIWYFSDLSRAASAVIMVLIFVGVALRRNRKLHPKMMLAAFALDVLLLLYVEFSRSAIEKSVSGMTPLLAIHIAMALGMLVLYVVLTRSGMRLLASEPQGDIDAMKKRHGIWAGLFIMLRLGVMATAVMVAR